MIAIVSEPIIILNLALFFSIQVLYPSHVACLALLYVPLVGAWHVWIVQNEQILRIRLTLYELVLVAQGLGKLVDGVAAHRADHLGTLHE